MTSAYLKKPIYVTGIKPRKRTWPERILNVPYLEPQPEITASFEDYYKWQELYCNFCVHESKIEKAKEINKKVWELFKAGNIETAKKIFKEELLPLKSIPFEKRPVEQKWAHMMVQMPGDIGGPNKKEIEKVLSRECNGNVLEAMCGFNSYLLPSKKRNVTALDFCTEALERYKYPDRKRILLDLNKIGRNKIDFFKEGEFDAITICFGLQYIKHPLYLFKEFHRLLSRGGSLYLVENPRQHYEDMSVRPLYPKQCASWMKKVFNSLQTKVLPISEEWEIINGGIYYLFKATKG